MTKGPVQLDVGVSYGLPRKGLPAAEGGYNLAGGAIEVLGTTRVRRKVGAADA
mgnify:CR=1 FL=1